MEIALSPLQSQGLPYVLAAIREVDAYPRVKQALQRAQGEEALRHAQRLESVGQLTGGIAHGFNNLLTMIHGNLQVLQDLPALAGDAYGLQLVDAAQLVASLADMLRHTLDQRIEIGVELEPVAPVLADPGQLESALLNIAINARDAMAEGGRLRFSCRAAPALPPGAAREAGLAEAPAGYVAIAVSDSGMGMPEAVHERAFEPFFTTKPMGGGTGLGLSTVYGFVTQSRDAGRAGRGGACAAREAAGAAVGGRRRGARSDAQLPGPLRLRGHELRRRQADAGAGPAARLRSAAERRGAGRGMRGPELARRATARWLGLAVLLMSGYSSQPVAQRDAGRHARRLLHKPCSHEQLAQAMAEALERD